MAVPFAEMFRCFVLVKHMHHYYHWYYLGDTDDGNVSIENYEKVVELMAKKPITKCAKNIDGGATICGITEHYKDRINIDIRSGEGIQIPDMKFSAMKEYCQIAYDTEESFEPDPRTTLRQLTEYEGPFLDTEMSPALLSEHVTEIMATELIYPLEYRKDDARFLQDGGNILDLVELRQVPAYIIERSSTETYIETCLRLWGHVTNIPTPNIDEIYNSM